MTITAVDSMSTLHLPRILCLHGGGTNACIFRMQCRVLERNLSHVFRFVYAEAPFIAQPGPGVSAIFKEYAPFKSWLRIRPDEPEMDARYVAQEIENSLVAARLADDLAGATGEWVGLLGFSQGAKLAASIVANQEELRRRNWHTRIQSSKTVVSTDELNFRFCILLAGRGPPTWLHPELSMPSGFVDAGECTMGIPLEKQLFMGSMRHRIRLPSIHLHGLYDVGLEAHRKLRNECFDLGSTTLLEWDGDHRVPIKTKDVAPLIEKILLLAWETTKEEQTYKLKTLGYRRGIELENSIALLRV